MSSGNSLPQFNHGVQGGIQGGSHSVTVDITPRKRLKIIAVNEETFMTVRVITTAVGEGKSRVLRFRNILSKKKRKMWILVENYPRN
ncbi:hypothetical protein TNCV_4008101 [Trichonephila clavipes]|nr:hypothetical protein TNCV_4008101 [Trichonephila clavipes]